jgi:hypothetical protein
LVEFLQHFLVEPGYKLLENIEIQGVTEEALVLQDHLRVVLEIPEVLLREDTAYHTALGVQLLFSGFAELKLPSLVLLQQPFLVGFEFLGFGQLDMSSLLVLDFLPLLGLYLPLLIQLHPAGLEHFAQ